MDSFRLMANCSALISFRFDCAIGSSIPVDRYHRHIYAHIGDEPDMFCEYVKIEKNLTVFAHDPASHKNCLYDIHSECNSV